MLDPLFDKLATGGKPIPRVITVPGNHDLKWSNSDFLFDYIGQIDFDNQRFPDRPQYLERHEEDFQKLDNEY